MLETVEASRNMFAIFFTILVVMALLSICGEVVMRVRLTGREPSRDKLVWWRRGGDEVADVYQEIYPTSRIPIFRKFVFWAVLASALILLLSILLRSP